MGEDKERGDLQMGGCLRQPRDGVIIASLRILRDVIITRSRLRLESRWCECANWSSWHEAARRRRRDTTGGRTKRKGQRELNSSSRVSFETGSRVDARFLVTSGPLVP